MTNAELLAIAARTALQALAPRTRVGVRGVSVDHGWKIYQEIYRKMIYRFARRCAACRSASVNPAEPPLRVRVTADDVDANAACVPPESAV